MPLFNMSANIAEIESVARKRAHSELTKEETAGSQCIEVKPSSGEDKENGISSTPTDSSKFPTVEVSPGLTESGSSPPEDKSPSPKSTPTRPLLAQSSSANATNKSQSTVQNSPKTSLTVPTTKPSSGEPPTKKTKRVKTEAEKIQEAEEREKKRKEKEETEKIKAELKAAKEAKRNREKEEKEQKRREKEEEEAKKARSQIKLTSMFTKAAAPKDKPVAKPEKVQEQASATTSEVAKQPTFYEQVFKPFYVKAHVKLADTRSADVDTCEAKSKILEEWVEGKRGELALGPFNPREACQLLSAPITRGRIYPSVRKIMSEYRGNAPTTIDLTTESQNTQIRQTRDALRSVPVKSLKFKEDVRPPYIGTVSALPSNMRSLSKIARNPTRKDVIPLVYDYDSEAEWQEDDGEDVDDLDDDEEDADEDEDMDGFLDDSEDVGPTRLLFSGGMEPESTGLCWENDKRLNETAKMYKYKMEFILETLDRHSGINPFSDEYWAPPPKPKAITNIDVATTSTSAPTSVMAPKACSKPSSSDAKTSAMAPPPVPSDAFQALAPKTADAKKTPQVLPAALQEELRALLCLMPNLSKLGVIEVFASNHAKCPKAQIKASFDALTEKSGKSWKLRDK